MGHVSVEKWATLAFNVLAHHSVCLPDPLLRLDHPVAFASHVDHVGLMGDAVDDGAREHGVVEHLVPAVEHEVRRYHRRALPVAAGQQVEQHLAAFAVERSVAEVVEDHQVEPLEALLVGRQLVEAHRLLHLDDQVRHVDERHRALRLAGLGAHRHRQRGLAHAGVADELEGLVERIVREHAPAGLEIDGGGALSVAESGLAAGDNPERMRSEPSFTMLCGASPVEASSDKTVRYGPTGAGTVGPTARCTASS